MDTLPLLPGSILTLPSLSDGGRCGRVKGWWSCAMFVWPASIHPRQAVGRGGGEGCGRGWSRAGLNDKGFVRCCDSYQDRPEPDNSWGHRSLETQDERTNESVLSWRVWSATAGSDGSDRAMANLSVLLLAGGGRTIKLYLIVRGIKYIFLKGSGHKPYLNSAVRSNGLYLIRSDPPGHSPPWCWYNRAIPNWIRMNIVWI